MPAKSFAGIRPHIQKMAVGSGIEPIKAEENQSVGRLNSLLCQAVAHAAKNNPNAAKSTLVAARRHLIELQVAADGALNAFVQACQDCDLNSEDFEANIHNAPPMMASVGPDNPEGQMSERPDVEVRPMPDDEADGKPRRKAKS